MPLLPFAVLGLLLLVSLFVHAFLLWLSCKICRVRRGVPGTEEAVAPRAGITLRRALGVVLALSLGVLLLAIAFWFAVPLRPGGSPAFAILALVVGECLLFLLLRALVSPTLGRAVLVGLLWQSLGVGYAAVLVVAFGAFLVRAYVVPSGAMAETVRGYHKNIRCPACGFAFAVNCSAEVDPVEGRAMKTFACVCPNCRQHIHFPSAPASYHLDHPDSMEIADPGSVRGDGILVSRGMLGAGTIAPRRFDLVAHEFQSRRQSLVYLKRLIGLPSETIAIRGGELYVLDPDKGLQYDDAGAEQEVEEQPERRPLMHPNDPEAIRRFEQGQFAILRKSPEQILVMRHIVYDNDHPSPNQPARWRGDAGWKTGGGHTFELPAGSAERTSWLRYRHVLPDNQGEPALITDFTGYNTYQSDLHLPLLGGNWVGDLILECEAAIDDPQGELTLELSKGADRFRARFDPATGTCALLRANGGAEQELDSKPTALRKRGTYRLRFANVDERLVVWVNGELPFDGGVTYAPAGQLGPQKDNDLEPAGVGVKGGGIAVSRLKLFRDTYYTVGGAGFDRPNEPDVAIDPAKPETWDGLRSPPLLTMYVQPGQYFLLGDNSAESSDSRWWGCVPDRLLLGKAFFVYYPLKRVGPLR